MSQSSLFPVDSLEERLNYERNHGLRDQDLREFSIQFLSLIARGCHNVDIPKDMQDRLNPSEIVALYIAGRQLKKNGHVETKGKPLYLFQLEQKPFEEIVSQLCAYAFDYPAMQHYNKIAPRVFSQNPGTLQERMRLFAQSEQGKECIQSFYDSLKEPIKESNGENPEAFHYYSRNCDGQNKRYYIDAIVRKS